VTRRFDVVVFGATSVTGRETVRYLRQREPTTGASWAAAGRNRDRLASTLATAGAPEAETVVADVSDQDSLLAMARRARVVVNLVGPYTRYGEAVIAACVAEGAHYVDLTGEIPFARRMLASYDQPARAARVKIVQVCGFEALPADVGVALVREAARERHDEDLTEVDAVLTSAHPPWPPRPSDLLSAGTMHSIVDACADPDAAAVVDPAALLPEDVAARVRQLSPIQVRPRRTAGGVVAPMAPAAFINPAVIHRSQHLADAPPIRYREGMAIPGPVLALPLQLAGAGAVSLLQAGLAQLARSGPATRERVAAGLRRVLPGSGYGPRPDRLDSWRWLLTVTGTTTSGHTVVTEVDAEGHPGYLATSRMLGETGLLLAEEGATPDVAGHLTPSAALGTTCAPRFDEARVRFRTLA
jgi:short subunit dehydrogenase-like uncharacterized protein